jgi:hypothetical protein
MEASTGHLFERKESGSEIWIGQLPDEPTTAPDAPEARKSP